MKSAERVHQAAVGLLKTLPIVTERLDAKTQVLEVDVRSFEPLLSTCMPMVTDQWVDLQKNLFDVI